jgi:hypothetical protein
MKQWPNAPPVREIPPRLSLGAVIYKGSGFYVTDTRKEKDIENIGKPDKERGKYPQFSGWIRNNI